MGALGDSSSSKASGAVEVTAGDMRTSISVEILGWMVKSGNASIVFPASA